MRSLIVLLILRGAETAVLELTNSTGSPPSIILGDCKITAIGEGRIRSTCVDERVEALQGELDLIKKALFQPPSLPPSPSSPPPAPSLPPFPLTDAMVYLPFVRSTIQTTPMPVQLETLEAVSPTPNADDAGLLG